MVPETDLIGEIFETVSGPGRVDPHEPLCRTVIPPDYGSARAQWIRRCYVYGLWVRDQNRSFVETIKFHELGNDRWDALDPDATEGRRTFAFQMESRSRQGTYMEIWDRPDNLDSHIMLSMIYFFPRKNLPAIRLLPDSRMTVTLPTGEEVLVDSAKRKILGGALVEGSFVDRRTDASKRSFPDITYVGAGISVRVDAQAADPRLWNVNRQNYAVVTQGHGPEMKSCKIHPSRLWNQDPSSPVEFLFETDAKFAAFLKTARDALSGEACGIR